MSAARYAVLLSIGTTGTRPGRWAWTLVAAMIAVLFASPLVAVLLGSLKTPAEAAMVPPTYLPEEVTFAHYTQLWEGSASVGLAIVNSAVVAAGSVALTVALALLAAYAFHRYPFRGSEIVFVVMLAAIMVPFQVLEI
ncbi:MAG: carbohydrate ABC transporter permease, partial [Phycisphaerales bacterium JB038]